MDIIEQLKSCYPSFEWSPKLKIEKSPESGLGVVCTEPIKPNERIIHIPLDMLINVSTLKKEADSTEDSPRLTVHERLALETLRRRKISTDLWAQSLPSVFGSMPIDWSHDEQSALPQRYRKRVAEQAKEIRDFATKCNLSHDEAEWAWKAVNTRCLYWEDGGMTLAPALDYLNHDCGEVGTKTLSVKQNAMGITAVSKSAFDKGEEVTFSYGPHENGFLLVEYGFVVENNPWNFADISENVASIAQDAEEWLRANHYWGDWSIDKDGQPSFRVEVALAAAQLPSRTRILDALVAGHDDGSRFTQRSRSLLRSIAVTELDHLVETVSSVDRKELVQILQEYITILRRLLL